MVWMMDNWKIHQMMIRMLNNTYPDKDSMVVTTKTVRVM